MKSRVVRVVLFLLIVLAFGAASYNIATIEQHQAAVRAAANSFEADTRLAEGTSAELKAARYAAVAAGQGPAFWTERSTALAASLTGRLQQLQRAATSDNARAALAGASQTLENSKPVDATAQTYIRNGELQLAAELIFSDLRQAHEALSSRLASARDDERAATDAALEAGRRMELATAAGAGVFALLVMLLLLPGGRRPEAADEENVAGIRLSSIAPSSSTPVKAEPSSSSRELLSNAASLCTDFARLKETSELPALLARLAGLLNAAGIIVWISDQASEELRPAAAHGYAANALSHIRAISKDADNATASAFRHVSLRVVEAEGSGNGAIAVPLVTPDGCVGVMAAELRGGGERQSQTQAIATIVAAQIATLVAPQDVTEVDSQ